MDTFISAKLNKGINARRGRPIVACHQAFRGAFGRKGSRESAPESLLAGYG